LRNRNEIRTGSALVDNLIRDAFFAELEVARRLLERGIEDGIVDDYRRHASNLLHWWSKPKAS
jgi:hypothetical protein